MKNQRQEYLLQIIAEETVETQEQLLERLQERGIRSTQATISRDIKELHLIKEPVGQGRYRYAVSAHRTKLNFADRLRTIFREGVLSVDYAQNLVVIKTMPGLANGAPLRWTAWRFPIWWALWRGTTPFCWCCVTTPQRRSLPTRSRRCCAETAPVRRDDRCWNCSISKISPSSTGRISPLSRASRPHR